jgi:hypothetical protein
MPPLSRPERPVLVSLPPRDAVVAGEADVLVVGGGPAGLGAAIGAAEAGADVILVERYGFLGGNATVALVLPLMSFHTQREAPPAGEEEDVSIMPTDHGPGDPVVAGVLQRLLERLVATGGAVEPSPETGYTVPGDREAFEVGREDDGLTQPMTLMVRMVEFERPGFSTYVRENPDQWRGVHGLWDLIEKATADGRLDLPREDLLFFATPHEREVTVNSTRVGGVLGIDVWDLTSAEWQARRQMRQIAAFLRDYVPGFEKSYVAQSGVNVGVRETRRIRGEYQLTADDVLTARKFPDAVARGSYPVDIHNPKGSGTVLQNLPLGEAYDIPLRCLLPQEVDRLLVAGRCISGTHEAHSSYRVTPIAMATGHAAGVCAALASRSGTTPRRIPPARVQDELLAQGANLGNLGR